jgi:hypothetical protein
MTQMTDRRATTAHEHRIHRLAQATLIVAAVAAAAVLVGFGFLWAHQRGQVAAAAHRLDCVVTLLMIEPADRLDLTGDELAVACPNVDPLTHEEILRRVEEVDGNQ